MKYTVQLLPSSYITAVQKQNKLLKTRVWIVAAIAVFAVLSVGSSFALMSHTRQVKGLKKEIVSLENTAASLGEYTALYQQLSFYQDAQKTIKTLDNNVFYKINEITKVLPSDVWIDTLSFGADNTAMIAFGSNSFGDITRTTTAISALDFVQSCFCNESSDNAGTVNFNVQIVLTNQL